MGSLKRRLLAILAGVAAWGLLMLAVPQALHLASERGTDLVWRLLQDSKPERRVVVIDVDDESLAQVGPWPWPRATLAQLISRLDDAGVALKLLDVTFPDQREGSDELSQALKGAHHESASPSVLGQVFALRHESTLQVGSPVGALPGEGCLGAAVPGQGVIANAAGLHSVAGHISPVIDADGVRWADDSGSDNYDLPGFWDYRPDGKRWNYFRNTNFSHNTLAIDNKLQHSGGKGLLDRYRTEGKEPFGIIDMTTAYQGQAASVLRGFKLMDNHTMLIQDEVTPLTDNQSITWSLITSANIELEGTTATLKSEGKQFFIWVLSPTNARLHAEEAKTYSELENPLTGYQMLKITVDSKSINESPLTILVGSNKLSLEQQANKAYNRISSWN